MSSNHFRVRTNVFKRLNSLNHVMKRGVIVLLLLFTLVLPISVFALDFKGEIEGVYLVRPESKYLDSRYYPPEYLETEDLIYYTCLEESNLSLKSTVICKDNNDFDDVSLLKWGDRKSTRLNSSHTDISRMPSSA